MTRKDIIREIAEQFGLTHRQVKQIVAKTFDGIIDMLVEDGRAELRGFGVFEVKRRKARQARNPRTGEKIAVPLKFAATFRPGLALEQLVADKGRTALAREEAPPQGDA